MAARTNRMRHDDETRRRIQTIALVDRVQTFALAPSLKETDPGFMHRSQLNAALSLLRKTLPDLSSVEITENQNVDPDRLTDAELVAFIRRSGGEDAADSPDNPAKPH